MSTPEPVSVRFTKSREEIIELLEGLAHDEEARARFASEPQAVLEEFGIEVTPEDAIPKMAIVPSEADIEQVIEKLQEQGIGAFWPWIAFFPWIGLFFTEEDDGGTPAA